MKVEYVHSKFKDMYFIQLAHVFYIWKKIINRLRIMIEDTYNKRNNIFSLINAESEKKRLKVVCSVQLSKVFSLQHYLYNTNSLYGS